MSKHSWIALALCVGSICATNSASAQSALGTGTVTGQVTDPSGAVVPQATVTLKSTATGATFGTKTNSTGAYVFPNIPPGNYDVTADHTGFSQARVAGQKVEVGRQLTINIPLSVGAASQSVEVKMTGTELETMNSTIGNTVNSDTLQSLPTLGRDVSSFVTMQPGVGPDGSTAGTVVDQAVFMLDGGNNSNDMDGSSGIYNPSFGDDPAGGLFTNVNNQITGINAGIEGGQPSGVMPTPVDSVEEFKVATSNQGADFNNSSGMQVSIVTRRGTNTYHGSAYEYYLDNNFSGNTWENNQSTPPTPVPDWHRNWFGASFGGPLIPKETAGGKTYFFVNYQGSRWPNSETLDTTVPSADMRAGILHDPGCPGGTCNLNTMDPRGIGMNTLVSKLWNTFEPMPTPGIGCGARTNDGYCDGVNTLAFRANLPIAQNDNFGVIRVDHDFASKWHFMSSFRYYHLTRATDDQVDIGGFFPGDKLGSPTALTNRPQVPWYLVVGMTTNISSHVTNDFRYSFLRNWWQWGSSGDPAQFSGIGAALEPLGEQSGPHSTPAPYNVNAQQTRTRFWDGKDHFFRDDVSWMKGNHLLQFGGQYQHNFNFHQRTDNGGGINYYPVYQLGDSNGSGSVDLSAMGANFTSKTNPILAREAAAVLGIVTDTQQALTRTGSNLALNPPLVPAEDRVKIPYYNLYLDDTWHLKRSLTVTYGLGWALEMPPVEEHGKQVVFVGANGAPINTESYLAKRQTAALAGQVYNPEIGFALLPNVAGHPKYPFDPYYHAFSPRIAMAWNPDLGPGLGGKNTVFRGGYGRIYGRVNGVNLVLTPLLSPGIIQTVGCFFPSVPTSTGACSGSANATTAFRIGTDGVVNGVSSAPIPGPPVGSPLPQPFFPGINGNPEAITASPLDPRYRPNSVDAFDFTIQHQISSKVSVEVGGISRWIHNELQSMNLNSVPYMMTLGGQQFKSAYVAVERAMGCTTSFAACGSATKASTLANLAPQPFFETALAGTGYCTPGNCTAAVVNNEFTNFQSQSVWTLWSDLDTNFPGTGTRGFNFPFSMMNTAGQMASNVAMSTSLGHGNYNGAFITLKMNDWRGVTMQNNFTWARALGTGGVVQATSQTTAVDVFHLDTQYGPQAWDRKFVDTMFLVWQPHVYSSQQGVVGHLLGGWSFAPVFSAGSGAPLFCNVGAGFAFNDYSAAQEFGTADGGSIWTNGNCIQNTKYTGGVSYHSVDGVANIFSNPGSVFSNLRPLILGFDKNSGGFGQFRGLPYWNVNLGIKKAVFITERVNAEASINFNNLFNHNQLLDPTLNADPVIGGHPVSTFGQLAIEGTIPRRMELGLRVKF